MVSLIIPTHLEEGKVPTHGKGRNPRRNGGQGLANPSEDSRRQGLCLIASVMRRVVRDVEAIILQLYRVIPSRIHSYRVMKRSPRPFRPDV